MYTCTKYILLKCNEECEERLFTYVVNGCTVTFYSSLSGGTWHFGDGGSSSQTNPTYTYTNGGDYVVTYTDINGNICRKTIRVACDPTPPCCTAAFTAEIKRNCSELNLSLSAECTSNGTHSWTILPISPNTCMSLENFFQGMPIQGMIQVTNINTCEVSALVITHNFTCSNGTVLSQTQTIPITDPGIYIGISNTTTQLTDYNCVLPGASYNGGCTVYSTGYVEIDKTFTFSNSVVKVHPGEAGFDVINLNIFTLNQNTEVSANTECPCLWRGIDVLNARMFTDTDAIIKDALFAIRGRQKSRLDIKKTHFLKNYLGIRATEGLFTLLSFEDNEFDGSGPLKDICVLAALNDVVNIPPSINWCEQPVQYNSGRGFAGMYLRDAGFVDLLPLPYANQNLFYNLAVGIFAKDTELRIRQNSRFKDIIPIPFAYDSDGGAAIRYIDTNNKGVNGFRMSGNGKFFGLNPDFDNCSFGICLATSVTADVNSGTRVGINECRFLKSQIGVYLDNLCSVANGVFTGRKANHEWRGVWDNYIEVNPTTGDQFVVLFSIPKSGIVLADYSPSQSAPEIWQNTIDVNQDNICGASFGIRAFGLTFTSPLLNQVDINKNRINLNAGLSGINTGLYDGAQIHDNSDAAFPGAGIFLNYQHFHQLPDCDNNVDFSTGISLNTGKKNLVGCNDITSIVPGNHDLRVLGQTDGTYVQNSMSGGRFGAIIAGGFSTERFACNTMSGYTENGLFLFGNTSLGDQGTFSTMTHGNKWINSNPAITDAFIQLPATPNNSRFFVRMLPGENPTTNTVPNTWFIPNVPNNVAPTCYYECPITAPQAFESELTYADTAIAEGTLIYQEYPEANQWINERSLLEKLSLNPELSSGSSVMADFLDSHEQSAMGQLVEVNSALGSLFQLSEGNKNALTSITQTTKVMLNQLFYLDSIAGIESSPELEETNIAQRDSLAGLLDVIQKEADSLAHLIGVELKQQGTIVLASLNDIVPTNDFEFNEKFVLGVYLNFLVSENQLLPGTADSLYNIGRECLFISGPCVYNARNLYGRMTGIALPDVECPVLGNRNKRSVNAALSDVLIFPNPSNDILIVRLLADIETGTSYLKMYNVLGGLVFDAEIQAGENEIPTKHLPSGTYFVQIVQNGMEVLTTSVLIQH